MNFSPRKLLHGIVAILILSASTLVAQETVPRRNLSLLADPPEWSQLDAYQKTMTRPQFSKLLERVYAPRGAGEAFFDIQDESVKIPTYAGGEYVLQFAPDEEALRPNPRYWKVLRKFRSPDPDKPMLGLTIALDPGHIGGKYAQMEERWFQLGNDKPVMEGDMVLKVAQLMKPPLEKLGAKVILLRTENAPVTSVRPKDLKKEARTELVERGVNNPVATYSGMHDPRKPGSIQSMSEMLFYRASEIRARGRKVREIRPDLVLCLHFNAESWGNASKPRLVDVSHFHILINGAYSRGELSKEDIRYEMTGKLLGQAYYDEVALADVMARVMAKANRLPPFTYRGDNAIKVGESPYVWARNLLANRIFECPTLFLEPYVMNSKLDYKRIQMGDYEGMRLVNGIPRKSIYREYADSVVDGLKAFFF
ncbi:N-acetylmuramoyl-L-alanine amidase [Kamptonema cortianum]|nr:N-acetylmuramoyl-L-alanine amidase [Kamptonema cortianum]